jgi:hypothetical protein
MSYLWNFLIYTFSISALIVAVLWFFRELISSWLTVGIKYKYETNIEELRAELRKDYDIEIANVKADLQQANDEIHSKLLHELEIIREKEMGSFKDKIAIYRLAVDIFAELYVGLQQAFKDKAFSAELVDKYNYGWVRCYGYLSMLAPQEVMDSFDQLNDYILNIINKRSLIQPWAVTRGYALKFLNSLRKDIGLAKSDVEYRGQL